MRGAGRARVWGAAASWLVGVYFLPLAHNVGHRNDHSHEAPTAAHAPSHAHDAEHSHPHPHREAPEDKVPLDSEHGAGSVLHFAAAALEARGVDLPQEGPPALLPPPPSPRVAPELPLRIVLVRGPPVVDSL